VGHRARDESRKSSRAHPAAHSGRELQRDARQRSDALDKDAVGVSGEGLEIIRVRSEDSPTRLGHGHNDCVYRRPAASPAAQERGSPREALRNAFDHVASLQQLVLSRVPASVSLEAFNKDDGGDSGWP